MEPLARTIDGTRHALSVSRGTVYNLINENKLEVVKVRGRTLITTRSIRALLGLDEEQEAA